METSSVYKPPTLLTTPPSLIHGVRLAFLRASAAVARGAHVRGGCASRVAAVLCATDHAAQIARFLYGGVRGNIRVLTELPPPPPYDAFIRGFALAQNNEVLLLADRCADNIRVLRARDGAHVRTIGTHGRGPLQFNCIWAISVAPDGAVFITDSCNNRVQMLTSDLEFGCIYQDGFLCGPHGVCANATHFAVSPCGNLSHGVRIYDRATGAFVRVLNEESMYADDMCFLDDQRSIAVAFGSILAKTRTLCGIRIYALYGAGFRHINVSNPRTVYPFPQVKSIAARPNGELLALIHDTIFIIGAGGVVEKEVCLGLRASKLLMYNATTIYALQGLFDRIVVIQ